MSNKNDNQDSIKHVEFLFSNLKDFRNVQDNYYKDLSTKMTFLLGFTISVMTIYGTYATQVNGVFKRLTVIALVLTLISLTNTLRNRVFYHAAMDDIDVSKTTYFEGVYQSVSNLKKACDDNESPLVSMANSIKWGVRFLIVSMTLLGLSIILPVSVLKSGYAKDQSTNTLDTPSAKVTDTTSKEYLDNTYKRSKEK